MKNFCKDHGTKIIVQREKDTINRRKKNNNIINQNFVIYANKLATINDDNEK